MAEFYGDIECYRQENGMYRPTLDTHNAVLGCFIEKGKKKNKFFNLEKEPESMYQYMLDKIEAEGKRGHVSTFWFFNTNYDWTGVIRKHYYDENIKYICFRPFIAEIKTKNGTGVIRDVASLFPKMRLEDVGKIVELPKGNMPKEVFSAEQLKAYCQRDCEILHEALKEIKKTMKKLGYSPKKLVSINKLGYNLLQQFAMNDTHTKDDGRKVRHYGYWWNKGRIIQTKQPEIIRMASRGGRIEAYKWGAKVFKHVYKLDVNSMYSYSCCTNPFPDLLKEKVIQLPTEKDLEEIGVSEATLKAPETFIPYLPIRHGKVVIYPSNAIIRGYWTNFEIRRAIEEGYTLLDIHKMVAYKPLPFNMFERYFKTLYKIKRNKENKLRPIAKLLANSSTGRFAMQTSRKENKRIHRKEIMEYIAQGYDLTADCGDGYIIVTKETEAKHYSKQSNPIIFAHITAYARDYLYKHMKKVNPEDLLYVVTDAIIFKNKENLKHFKVSEEMGDWKIEKAEEEAEIFNEHYYRIGKDIRASGTKKKDINLEALRTGKEYKTSQMYTVKMAWNTGEFHKVGSFFEKPMKLSRTPKRARPYPKFIRENSKDQMERNFALTGIT